MLGALLEIRELLNSCGRTSAPCQWEHAIAAKNHRPVKQRGNNGLKDPFNIRRDKRRRVDLASARPDSSTDGDHS